MQGPKAAVSLPRKVNTGERVCDGNMLGCPDNGGRVRTRQPHGRVGSAFCLFKADKLRSMQHDPSTPERAALPAYNV